MRQGDSEQFEDNTYDGLRTADGYLSGGLGQLTDLEEGMHDLSMENGRVFKGFKEDSVETKELERSYEQMLQGNHQIFQKSPGNLKFDDFSQDLPKTSQFSDHISEHSNETFAVHRWVGWKREPHSAPLNICFKFDRVRVFSEMRFVLLYLYVF